MLKCIMYATDELGGASVEVSTENQVEKRLIYGTRSRDIVAQT